ncbi:cell division cycle-related protein res2/pct1 [Echria macrotheca]|uniref:Cell division cycle-related protein res2/pct1 n=1 Tax=Echria macrotheca TaxID=438768 RepID=A0AAJ0BEH9_9PEZI|nr:cell division cycle-related protein res2/pct1 [Echria macrotheca]
MRRRQDDWINATHILKAVGLDKPARTRVLEREVQKDTHEKIQGGYGKYQGTWIPLESGIALARRNNIYEQLRPIFEYQPGNESPPPAPRHASKPKVPKPRPAVPKWNSKSTKNNAVSRANTFSQALQGAPVQEEYDGGDTHMHEDDTPDNLTVASASYMGEEDGYDMSQFSTGHRKRKRDDLVQDMTEQQHAMYGDELLDYFLLSRNEQPAVRPDPPTNFQPDWPIDHDRHTSLHWASAMGDVEVMKQLKRFGANLLSRNIRGETPLMRAVHFTNCCEKSTFPQVLKELFTTIDARDSSGATVIHHAAAQKTGRVSQSASRYYLDHILNELQVAHDRHVVQQVIDAQDNDGNTAIHLAAQQGARKCIRALLGRGASVDIPNHEGRTAQDQIKELNDQAVKSKASRSGPQRSSSPFGPDSQRHSTFRDALGETGSKSAASFTSEAANMVQSRMTSLVMQKFQDLAHSYDQELKEKEEAEREARRILINTKAELENLRTSIADLESRLEADEAAAKTEAEASALHKQVLDCVIRQNRIAVAQAVEQQLAALVNGDADHSGANDSLEERLQLAAEVRDLLREQRLTEAEYVEARGMLGTSEKIDKYRHLLRSCLSGEDQDLFDANLEEMIRLMEDEAGETMVMGNHAHHHQHQHGAAEPMEIAAL